MAELWNLFILDPMLNGLVALSSIMPREAEFGLAIILLTIVVRLALTPLTLKQLRSVLAMQGMQPKLKDLQKKYARNQQKLKQETSKLYAEAGVNPLGCVLPMLVQFPVWIALYQSIMKVVAVTPDALLDLSQHLYSSPLIAHALPVNSQFLWINLGESGDVLLAVLVGATMWVQQKMTTAPTSDPKQKSTNDMMLMMMPFMFAVMSLMFPSGLPLFWLVSNIIGIATQYFIVGGWGYLRSSSATTRRGGSHKIVDVIASPPHTKASASGKGSPWWKIWK